MPRRAVWLVSFLCCVLAASPLTAQDSDDHQGVSNILGAGARAWGMGGAFIALADDATAASWNPAGLAHLVRPEVSLVVDSGKGSLEWRYRYETPIGGGRRVDQSIRDTGQTDYSGIAFASATWPMRLRGAPVVTQLSYRRLSTFPGILNPYRTSTTLFDGRGDTIKTSEDADLYETAYSGGFDSYGASFAVALGDKAKIGATANYVRSSVQSSTIVAGSSGDAASAELEMAYAFSGVALDAGVLYAPIPELSLGAVYHSGFTAPFWYESSLRTSDAPAAVAAGRTRMRWPDGFGMGLAVRPTEFLTISADASRTRWSKATVDQVRIATLAYDGARGWKPELATMDGLGFPYFGARQHDTTNVRIGAEYVTFYRGVAFPIRVGAFREDQATNAWDEGDDVQRKPRYTGYTAGVGMAVGHVQVDLAYVLTTGSDRGRSGQLDGATMVDEEIARVRNQRVIMSALYRF